MFLCLQAFFTSVKKKKKSVKNHSLKNKFLLKKFLRKKIHHLQIKEGNVVHFANKMKKDGFVMKTSF